MRLIDADALKRDLKSVTLSNGTLVNANTILALLDKYPTAYDLDKVAEQLEEKAELAHKKCTIYPVYNPLYDRYDTQYQELKACLEIVKGGGMNV